MYKIVFSQTFLDDYQKFTLKNIELRKRVQKALEILSKDPFYPSLKSHKVYARNIGVAWSSRVTGDIRIIWEYNKNDQLIIDALALGSHSGNSKVYN